MGGACSRESRYAVAVLGGAALPGRAREGAALDGHRRHVGCATGSMFDFFAVMSVAD